MLKALIDPRLGLRFLQPRRTAKIIPTTHETTRSYYPFGRKQIDRWTFGA
jgi:hypothetical protein